jgi:NADPH-dependent 7-cyano-7-deazaguanine reductase QueF-like protein
VSVLGIVSDSFFLFLISIAYAGFDDANSVRSSIQRSMID